MHVRSSKSSLSERLPCFLFYFAIPRSKPFEASLVFLYLGWAEPNKSGFGGKTQTWGARDETWIWGTDHETAGNAGHCGPMQLCSGLLLLHLETLLVSLQCHKNRARAIPKIPWRNEVGQSITQQCHPTLLGSTFRLKKFFSSAHLSLCEHMSLRNLWKCRNKSASCLILGCLGDNFFTKF